MRAYRLAILLALSVGAGPLGGCAGSSYSTDDALSVVGGALDVANAALAVSGGSAPRSTPTYSAPARTSTYTPPAGNGYSQKGAFDDCARLYGSAGMEQQARLCRQRSTNMGSLH